MIDNDNSERKQTGMIREIYNYFNLVDCGLAFRDQVTGRMVHYYRDPDGVVWMKESRWGLFRVRAVQEDKKG